MCEYVDFSDCYAVNLIHACLGLVSSRTIAQDGSGFSEFLLMQLIVAAVVFIPSLLFMRGKPKQPPSETARKYSF